jgi:hypothetical protein
MCALQQRLDRVLPSIRGGDPREHPPREGLARLWDYPPNRVPVLIAPAGTLVINLSDEAGVVEPVPQGALGVIAGIGVQTDNLAGTRITAIINGLPHRTYRNIIGLLSPLASPTADFLPIDLNRGDRFGVLVENITLPAININVAVRILGWFWYPEV